jgi:hypothetical protein
MRVQATRRGPVRSPQDLRCRAFPRTRLRCCGFHRYAISAPAYCRSRLRRQYAERFGHIRVVFGAKYGVIAPDVIIAEAYEVRFNNPATGLIAFDRLRQQVPKQQLVRFPVIVGLDGFGSAQVVTLATPPKRNGSPG